MDDAPKDEVQETLDHIEEIATQMVVDNFINPESLETARILLGAMHFQTTNADRLASLLGLQRDFVRAQTQRLRQNGVWLGSKYVRSYINGPMEYQAVEFLLHMLCAEGLILVRRTPEGEVAYCTPPILSETSSPQ